MSALSARIASGAWYSLFEDELAAMRATARRAVYQHNMMNPDARGPCGPLLADLMDLAPDALIEAPFHCSYGCNTSLASGAFINAGGVILDSTRVSIGANTMLGPRVQIITADHHRDPAKRRQGIERARPVTLGADVWVGAGAVILPGVHVGDGAIIGANAVVTRDVAPGTRVAGVPARAL